MSPDRDHLDEHDVYDEEPPRSIFAATWFRALLVLIVLGVVGAVAVPYVLDIMNPPAPKQSAAVNPVPGTPPGGPTTSPSAPPPGPPPVGENTGKDSTMIPAPAPAAPATTAMPSTQTPASPASPSSKPATPETKPAPATSAMSATEPKPSADKSVAKPPAKATDIAKVTPSEADKGGAAKSAGSTKKPPVRTAAKTTVKATPPAATGAYWVQIGAFRDEATAKRLVAKLQEQDFKAEQSVRQGGESAPKAAAPAAAADRPATGGDHYDVLVTGESQPELSKRLSAKGLAVEASGSGIVIRPSLPLRDAVALSKDLAVDGFKVQVRRAGGAEAAKPAARRADSVSAGSGEKLYRVRVGGFADRTGATTALRDLESKGYKGFIARGDH